MKESRVEKLAPLGGVVFVALAAIGILLLGTYDYKPSAERAVEIFASNPGNVAQGGGIGAISAFFFIWFAGSVFAASRDREGGSGWLSTVAFGGGVATGLAVAVGMMVLWAGGARAGAPGGITPEGAVTLYDLYSGVMGGGLSVAMAVFIGATAVVSLRTMMFPAWFGWVSALIALGLLTPIHYIFEGLAMVWIVVVSIWLNRRGTSPA
ncbi:MAG: hypothetical protein ACE5NC_04875 [Anaerolineae bacterium]